MTWLETNIQRLLAEEPFVRALARGLVAGDADDVVQQTWVRALEARPASPLREPRKWLGRIVKNLVTDLRRRDARRRVREDLAANRDRVPSSAELMVGEEVRRALVAAVDALPVPQRTVVLMRYYDGLPPRRIAAELGLPVATVWNRLHTALKALRARLDARTRGDRHGWLLPLVPFATTPRSLPFRETLSAAPAAGVIAMTLKSKVATALAVALAAAVVWIAWPDDGSPGPEPTGTAVRDDAGRAAGGVHGAPDEAGAAGDLARENVAAGPVTTPSTTGTLVVDVRYGEEPRTAAGLVVIASPSRGDHRVDAIRAVTDDAGQARFEDLRPERYRVWTASRASRVIAAEIEAGETTECEIVLASGIALTGIVVDDAGAPVGGAVVETVMPAISGADAQPVALTAADGTFRVRECDPLVLVGARATHFAASPLQLINSEPGASEHVRIELSAAGGVVEGTVLDAAGAPVDGAVVRVGEGATEGVRTIENGALPLPAQVHTDADGRFRAIGVPGGTQPLMVRTARHAPWRGSCEVPPAGTASVRVVLRDGVTCRGIVRMPDGAPAVATVAIGDAGAFDRFRAQSDAEGAFTLTGLPAGELEVKAYKHRVGRASARVHGVAGRAVECELQLSAGIAIRGRVVDPDGEPIGYAQVLREIDGGGGAGAGITYSGEDGRFILTDCPANVLFELAVSADDFRPRTLSGVDPRDGEVEVVLRRDTSPKARIAGRLLRPDGTGAIGAKVVAGRRDPQRFESVTIGREDGAFSFEVAAGTWWLFVDEREHPRIEVHPRGVEAGSAWDVGTLTLTAGGTLVAKPADDADYSYRILDLQERYVGGLRTPAPPPRSQLLAPGDYLLAVAAEGRAARVLPFSIRPGEDTELAVALDPGVRQRLVFESVTPGAELPYSLPFAVREGDKLVARESARRPANGRYEHSLWLAPGSYALATTGDGPHGEITFEVGGAERPALRVPLR